MYWYTFVFAAVTSALQTLPPVNWTTPLFASSRSLPLESVNKIIYLEERLVSWKDHNGLTLIPPTASDFAQTFLEDLQEITNEPWELKVVDRFSEKNSGIFLGHSEIPGKFTYEDGTPTEEGYELVIGKDRISILGSGARGMWWGTRTVLQQIVLSENLSLPLGSVVDVPAYPVRGFMLDAGRKWYSLDYLKDLCTYASFFKLSEFHYHATDNYPLSRGPDVSWNQVYSQFTLRPENSGLLPLVQRMNETLSRLEFDDFQRHCAQRGVTVVPEIESPGHSLSVTKWKPELSLESRDLLNLSHPETIPLIKSIWSEFLPWFYTKEVHIGADEYDSSLSNDYISFVNDISTFIKARGKNIRIWGTFEPSSTLSIAEDITIQHWQYGQSEPVALAQSGYKIINSEDWWAYLSLKNDHVPISPAPYPQFFNTNRILNFADIDGWQWAPNLFNPVNVTNQPDSKAVRGAIMAAWNDNGPSATTQLESFYAIRNGIPVVASRAWSGTRGPYLNTTSLDRSIDLLTTNAVGQNLDRILPKDAIQQPKLTFSWIRPDQSTSKNYQLGLGSKGINYTLELDFDGPFSLDSDDAKLSFTTDSQLVFSSDGFTYPLRSVAETDGWDPAAPGRIWANITTSTHKIAEIPSKGHLQIRTDKLSGSRVWIDGTFMGRFEVFIYGGKNKVFSWSQMAFVAPLEAVLGSGLQKITLYSYR
ncbi:hypothetical protein N7495_004916 [Penicillium taxi]|uniref:uncharacterized protein n=1 Tax=Penicillium taxi TaxID=168475 RepID=UPI0025450930|nr:uncharacterized protein N7495_004916 [Penicillium taxi]KAJ5893225.1 hypothetical protein N7495_004916 [Penicillium taxi]